MGRYGQHHALVGGYNLLGEFADYDRIRNGIFDSDTEWVKGDGWSIASNVAHCDGSQVAVSNMQQYDIVEINSGKKYRAIFTIKNYSAGNIRPFVGAGGIGTWRSANGTYIEDIILPDGGDASIYINADADFIGDIDDVIYQELYTPDYSGRANHGTVVDAVATPWGYSFSGANQFINLGNNSDQNITGEITIIARIRTSSSASQMIYGAYNVSVPYEGCGFRVFSTDGRLGFWSGGHQAWVYGDTAEIDDGLWHDVAVSLDAAGNAHFYLDNRYDGVRACAFPDSYSTNRYIGADTVEQAEFVGDIGKVLIIPAYLTQRETQEEMRRSRYSGGLMNL